MKPQRTFWIATVILTGLVIAAFCSCKKDDQPVLPPTLTTLSATEITETSAKSGGNITNDGGGDITARGIVWSTEINPSLENHSGLTSDGTGSGMFQSNITGLSAATTYFVRAYSTNSAGTSYGNDVMFETIQSSYLLTLEANPVEAGNVTGAGEYYEGEEVNITATPEEGWEFLNWTGDQDCVDNPDEAINIVVMPAQNISLTANFQQEEEPGTITDIDGNVYQTVIIGNQEWMAENLRVTKYNNGIAIPTGLGNSEWGNTTEGAYAIYDNDDDMLEAYGKLYNWYAVDDSRGLCPEGWSVPSDDDWTQLINYVVNQGFPNSSVVNGAGNALKSCRQVGHPDGGDCDTSEHPRWNSHGTHSGFDEFGFSALPGGLRNANGCYDVGFLGNWWSSSEYSSSNAWIRNMHSANGCVLRFNLNKGHGFSVRCVRALVPPEDD